MGLRSFFKKSKKQENKVDDSHIDINITNCDGCEKCIVACPNHVLIIENNKSSVRDFQVCKNCKICMAICPNNCITIN